MKFHLPDRKVDERDTMFARMARRANSPAYQEYYTRRPELKQIDDRLRGMPRLMNSQGKYYDPEKSEQARNYFDTIDNIEIDQEFVTRSAQELKVGKNRKNIIIKITHELGAVTVGYTDLVEAFIYSHRGRFDENYGQPINLDHSTAIVFLVEMDFDRMQKAPKADTILESAHQYYRAAVISLTLEAILQQVGHSAKAQYDAHYDLILPPLAVKAGLGELGRNNILIADKYGSRVRIGAVTTDLPLVYDEPRALGAEAFCQICKKCAKNCPSRALDFEGQEIVRGVEKWLTNVERCYSYWRQIGTDCGICMAVCPFSHHNNRFHNLVRWLIKNFKWSHRLALFFDDLIYGLWADKYDSFSK